MLSYSEMQALRREVSRELIGARFLSCVEVGPKKWILTFHREGIKKELLLCAQHPFNRFHLSTQRLQGQETPFTRSLQEKLARSVLIDIELLSNDRILDLRFDQATQELHLIAELCMRDPHVALVDTRWKILASWHTHTDPQYRLPQRKVEHVLKDSPCTSSEVEKRYALLEHKAAFERRVQEIRTQLLLRLKKAEKRLRQHQDDLATGAQWEPEAHLADLLKSSFFRLKRGLTEIELEDWEKGGEKVKIPLDPALEPQEQLKRRFKLSRKLKKRQEIAPRFIADAEKQISLWSQYLQELNGIQDPEKLAQLKEKLGLEKGAPGVSKQKAEKKHPFREFTTRSGKKIFVGKKDADNDQLTFTFAHGLDLWLHAANAAGSHVVLRVPKGEKVDDDALQDALQLALHFSKARPRGEDEVIVAECKCVSKSKGAKPGQVNVSKHQTVWVRLDPARLERLLSGG